MRLGENALFKVPEAPSPVVARVARTMDYWADAEKEVAVAAWLVDQGFPAVQVADFSPQPVAADGRPVTFWRWLPGRSGDLEDTGVLGRLLRRLHRLPAPPDALRPLDPFERIESRIAKAPIPESDKAFLAALRDRLRGEWERLDFALTPGPVHGDAHIKNLMMVDGRPVLIDLERFAWGQPEWDLAKTATESLTAGFFTRGQYRAFADSYGFDVAGWSGFPTLQQTTALNMVTWLMQRVGESRRISDEFANRMRTLRGESSLAWSAH